MNDEPSRGTPGAVPDTEGQLVTLQAAGGTALRQPPTGPETRGRSLRAASRGADLLAAARHRVPWPLAVVLAVQAALSLRLIWSNTAFEDEALYLWVGHMEWAHWLHGAPVQPFQTRFSGAPELYPPLAAVADSIGGLTAARLLSLVFMTGVTCFLWATARSLVGGRAALVAAAAFATLAGTAFLGAFATYDALALLLLSCATWVAVRASRRPVRAARYGMPRLAGTCLLAGVLLGVACAVKYASALFVPSVLIVAVLAAWREAGRQRAAAALAGTAAGVAMTLAAGLAAGGHGYLEGVLVTTLNRPAATASPFTILKLSYLWTGFILVMAVLAVIASRGERAVDRWLLAVLAMTAFLVPAEQIHVATTVSLHKHVVFGAWFASMAAGYPFARLSRIDTAKGWAAVAAIPIVACTLLDSIPQAGALFADWVNTSPITAILPPLIARYPGRYLTSTDLYQVLGYYEQGRTGWTQWQSDLYFSLPGSAAGPASDLVAIRAHYFSLIIIATQRTSVTSTDESVLADMRKLGGYRIVADARGFEAWTPAEES